MFKVVDQAGFRPVDYQFGIYVIEQIEKIKEPELV